MMMTTAATATDERNEMFMWETSTHVTLHRMRDFVLQAMPQQPKLQVLIPKRNVTVPHVRSKRLQQLQSRPRDPNASPFLLMIAPLSDPRYRYMRKSENPNNNNQVINTGKDQNFDRLRARVGPTSQVNVGRQQQQQQPPVRVAPSWQETINGCQIPGPEYLQQISTIAAMAWSDCSQATEKLRRIYEQTALLSQNPLTVMNSCGQTLMTPSGMAPDFANKLNGFSQLQQQDLLKYDPSTINAFYDDRSWDIPSVYCACAVCQMTKRAKSSMLSHRGKADLTKATSTVPPHHVKQPQLIDRDSIAAGLANHNVRRNKRALSPGETFFVSQQPPRKAAKQEHHHPAPAPPAAKQPAPKTSGQSFVSQTVRTMNGSLLPYMCNAAPPQSAIDEASYLAQNLFMSGIQNPASFITSSSSEGPTQRELMATPSFENQMFVNSQMAPPSLGGGMLNGFTNFLPHRILNALE